MKKLIALLILSTVLSSNAFAKEVKKEEPKKEEQKYLTAQEIAAMNNYIGEIPTKYGADLRNFLNSKVSEK